MDLYRGFEYPKLVGYVSESGFSVLHGNYPDAYKIKGCIKLPALSYYRIGKIFNKYFAYEIDFMSKERVIGNLGTIESKVDVYPDIIIMRLKEEEEKIPELEGSNAAVEW